MQPDILSTADQLTKLGTGIAAALIIVGVIAFLVKQLEILVKLLIVYDEHRRNMQDKRTQYNRQRYSLTMYADLCYGCRPMNDTVVHH